jgi:hypothetical protein
MEASRKRLVERIGTCFWLLAASAFLLVQLGYTFESNDQVQYLLLPYREMYPDFLPGDWFTWSTSHYHVTFAWLVRALHALSGQGGFQFAMFGAHLASLAWLAYGLLRIARSLGGGVLEASFALFVFGCARDKGIGDAIVNHGCLLPSDLALAPFLLACAACLERRALMTGVWLGIAGFLHANFAVLGPAVVIPVAFAQAWPELRPGAEMGARARAVRALAISAGVCLLISAPNLVVLAGSFLAKDRDPASVAITLFVRSPHHYDLAYMLPYDFYWAALVLLIAMPAFVGRYALQRRAAAAWLGAVLLAWIAVGLLGTGLHIVPLARLFTLRMSIPLIALCLIAFACVARAVVLATLRPESPAPRATPRDFGGLAWLLAGLCVLALFVREDLLSLRPFSAQPYVADPSAPGVPMWLFASVLVPLAVATALVAGLRARRSLVIPILVAIPFAASLWVAHIPLGPKWTGARVRDAKSFHFAGRLIAWAPPQVPLSALYERTQQATPDDARILIPPGLFEFRMRARRAVYVDWKCAPMKGEEASEWKRRMLDAMGVADFPARGYALPGRADALYYARPLSDLLDLARREGLTHVLLRKSQVGRAPSGATVAFTWGAFAMLKLPP